MKAAIFTVDTELYREKKESRAAAVLKRMLEQAGFEVKAAGVLPADRDMAAEVMRRLADASAVELILTTGAVEYSEDDCAPDALADVADRFLPGIPEALRAYNMRHTKKAIMDRSAAGIRKNTLLINLPGNAGTAKEDMEYILPEVVWVAEALSL